LRHSGHPHSWHIAVTNTLCPYRRNLVEEVNATYMKNCLYHKTLHPLCPVFSLGYLVQESGQDFCSLAEKVWGWCQAGGALAQDPKKGSSGPVHPPEPP
jgi:hypothetical protein